MAVHGWVLLEVSWQIHGKVEVRRVVVRGGEEGGGVEAMGCSSSFSSFQADG